MYKKGSGYFCIKAQGNQSSIALRPPTTNNYNKKQFPGSLHHLLSIFTFSPPFFTIVINVQPYAQGWLYLVTLLVTFCLALNDKLRFGNAPFGYSAAFKKQNKSFGGHFY